MLYHHFMSFYAIFYFMFFYHHLDKVKILQTLDHTAALPKNVPSLYKLGCYHKSDRLLLFTISYKIETFWAILKIAKIYIFSCRYAIMYIYELLKYLTLLA